jgi:hypothetical protein
MAIVDADRHTTRCRPHTRSYAGRARCGEKKRIRRGKIRSPGAATKQMCEHGQLGRVDNRQHFVCRLQHQVGARYEQLSFTNHRSQGALGRQVDLAHGLAGGDRCRMNLFLGGSTPQAAT